MHLIEYFQNCKLTPDQESAILKINEFINSKSNVFLLKGYAGTGKTFLVKGLAQYLESKKTNHRLMAPTGRAAMILGQKTGVTAYTIHKTIYNYSELEEDESSFKLRFKLNINQDPVSTIYIIDEASMLSDKHSENEFFTFGSGFLLKDLFAFINIQQRPETKIMFIGDPAQLPPVNMNISPALSSDYLQKSYKITPVEFTMTNVVRQKTKSGILEAATNIRNSIVNNSFNRFQLESNHSDIQNIGPDKLLDLYSILKTNAEPTDYIVITHSNRQALQHNSIFRNKILEREKTVSENDVLIITHNNYNYPVELYNGMLVKVVARDDIVEEKVITYIIKGGEKVTRKLIFRDIVLDVLDFNSINHQVKCKILDNFLISESGSLHPYDQRALYVDFKERARKAGIKPKSDTFKEMLRKDPYFNAVQAKYGYAITCHKAQGGEWQNVIIDFNVFMGKLSAIFFRWAYTAITRAEDKLYSIDAPCYNPLSEFVCKPIDLLPRILKGTFYCPGQETSPTDPPNFRKFPFLKWRFLKIKKIMDDQGIKIGLSQDNWIEKYIFSRNGSRTEIYLWYNSDFFSTKFKVQLENDTEFTALIIRLLGKTLYDNDIPFNPIFNFQNELYNYLKEMLAELNLHITNILLEEYCDKYFLSSENSYMILEFWHNKKGIYTKLIPKSTLGSDDETLLKLNQQLKGDQIHVI